MVRVLSVGISGPLERYASGFAEALFARGFTRLSAANQLRVFAHVSRWLAEQRLQARHFTEQRAVAFLRARRRARYSCWCSRRGLDRVFEYLRERGVVRPPPVARPRGRLDRLVAQYATYLSDERGLAQTTVRRRADAAHRFLARHGATRAALRALTPADIHAYLRAVSRHYSPQTLAVVGSDLRSLFRFLFVEGIVCRSLAEAVPPAVGWRNRTIPSGLSVGDVRALIRSCDRQTAIGRRDYAVLMLLARLGLRAKEVASLTVDDIDWRHAEIVIHGKGARRERLPLPHDVGEALSAYLHQRPRVTERRIFLREPAPYRALQGVGSIVFTASQRAGIGSVWPHRLRRTAATEMLRRGATLSEIAQVLRHTVTQTTMIYAKVDRHSLRLLAQPWPGAYT